MKTELEHWGSAGGAEGMGRREERGVVTECVMRGLMELRALWRETPHCDRAGRTLVSSVFNLHIHQLFMLICMLAHTHTPHTYHTNTHTPHTYHTTSHHTHHTPHHTTHTHTHTHTPICACLRRKLLNFNKEFCNKFCCRIFRDKMTCRILKIYISNCEYEKSCGYMWI